METEIGRTYGMHNLPANVATFTMEFDMGLVEQVEQADKSLFQLIIEYVCHHVAKDDPTVAMRTLVGKDPDDPLAVMYQLQSTLPMECGMDDMHVEMIKHHLGPINCVTSVRWQNDVKAQRVLLMIDIRSLLSRALLIRDMDIVRIHARMNKIVSYESDGRSGSTKRTRLEKETK